METLLLSLGADVDKLFYGFDMAVFKFFGALQNDFMTYVAKFFTSFGDEAFIIPIVVLGIALCFFKKTRKFGFAIVFSIIIGTLITNVIAKPMFMRIRPYNTLQGDAAYWQWYTAAGMLSESDYSFPSGHTTGATEIAMAVFFCFMSRKKKIAWVFPAIALCTAGSRIYLMVHYPSDVLGGLIVGFVSAVCGYFLMKAVMLLFKKNNADDKLDAARLFKKLAPDARKKLGAAAITIAVVAIFLNSFIPVLSEGGEQVCAYEGEYSCKNAARVDDEDYPPIDGKEYCKIHWKQLMGQ